MRAIRCHALKSLDSLTLDEIPVPSPGNGEVLVRIGAAGVNFADLLVLAGEHYMRPAPPFVPGLEFAGTVVEVGLGVTEWLPGDRVMGAPPSPGCFAEYITLPGERLLAVPAGLSFAEAAGFIIAYGTAYFALKIQGGLEAGETVLISGAAGGVGIAAIDIAKRLGARVIAAVGSPAKLERALARGADSGVNYRTEDLRTRVKALTGGRGYDLFLDNVGGEIFDTALRAAAASARILSVGFASGSIPEVRLNYLITKNLSIIGAGFGGSFAASPAFGRKLIAELTALHASAPFLPEVSGVFALKDTRAALEVLSGRNVVGKLVIEP